MAVLPKLAYAQGRRDDVPDQQLARELAAANDGGGVKELAENLWNANENISSDCIKTLYELGFIKPELIAGYVDDFLRAIQNKNNRLVWGGMIALGTIAHLKAREIFDHLDLIEKTMQSGSVITVDNGVKTLALVAAASEEYNHVIFPFLLEHLKTCRSKEVPQHAEKSLPAVTSANRGAFIEALNQRMPALSSAQLARVKKVIKASEKK